MGLYITDRDTAGSTYTVQCGVLVLCGEERFSIIL